MAIKSILVAVSQYNKSSGCTDLPLCRNDLYAVKKALVDGLKANSDNIKLCGESGSVQVSDFINEFILTIPSISEDDIFIFYFSGHGGDNALILSDGFVYLQHLVDYISKFNCKNKLVILDCCKSGQANLDNAKHADISDDSIENFVGHGCAIMASCGANEVTGFNSSRNLSMYTSFLCDALTCRPLIRKGQKSLDAINEAILKSINNWNKLGRGYIPEPIFRSSIGGTIFFDVEEYKPYQTETFYDENEKYIIYQVEPTHASVKRLTVKVILRSHFTDEEIADIFLEIKDKVMYREIYSTKNQELFFSGKPSQLVFGFLGYDEEDIVNSNYAYRTIWVDDTQDKDNWYRKTKNARVINNIWIEQNVSYEALKKLMQPTMSSNELINLTRKYTKNLISLAEQYIKLFKEYINGVITEETLTSSVAPISKQISTWYFRQSDLPIPPKELHDWANCHCNLSNIIDDFTLFYGENTFRSRTAENRKSLVQMTIERYNVALEQLKSAELNIENII